MLFSFTKQKYRDNAQNCRYATNYKTREQNIVWGVRARLRAERYNRSGYKLDRRHVYNGKKYHRKRGFVPVTFH